MMYAQRAWDSFSLHLSSVKTQGICNTLSKAVRHYALEKKKILQRCMTKKATKEPHIVAVNCVHFRLTGQVTSGLRWEDLRHYWSRQSCFGQRRLDGPEPASPCKGKINVVTSADWFMFYSAQWGYGGFPSQTQLGSQQVTQDSKHLLTWGMRSIITQAFKKEV